MSAEFNWWLLIVGVVAGAALTWLVVADSSRREREVGERELPAEAAWIAKSSGEPAVDADDRGARPPRPSPLSRLPAARRARGARGARGAAAGPRAGSGDGRGSRTRGPRARGTAQPMATVTPPDLPPERGAPPA